MTKGTTDRRSDPTPGSGHRLLTPTEVAEILVIPIPTLYAWRYHSKGPPVIKIGRHLRYPAEGLRKWVQERAVGERRG